jgi:hypothetical protein
VRLENPNGQLSVNLFALWSFAPPVMSLWRLRPLSQRTSEPKDQRSEGNRVAGLCPLGATAKIFRNRGVRFACESTKLEPLRIRYFHIFDRGGKLFELASGCRFRRQDRGALRGHGSPQGVIDQLT